MSRRTKGVVFLAVCFGIDDDQIGVGVFLLERPNKMRRGINLETVTVARHGIGMDDSAVHAVFDNFAVQSVGTVEEMAIAIPDEDVAVNYSNGIGRTGAFARGKLRLSFEEDYFENGW